MTLRCNPERSPRGDLSVPRYHRPDHDHGREAVATFVCSLVQHTVGQRSCQDVEDSLGGVSEEEMLQKLFLFSILYSPNHPHVCLLLCTLASEGCTLLL